MDKKRYRSWGGSEKKRPRKSLKAKPEAPAASPPPSDQKRYRNWTPVESAAPDSAIIVPSKTIIVPSAPTIIVPSKKSVAALSGQSHERFRGLLPDLDSLTSKIIEADLDHTQAYDVANRVDDLVDWAPNAIVFASDRRFLGMRPFAKQVEILLYTFEEFCFRCSDMRYMTEIAVDDTLEKLLSKVALLEFGRCPHCGATKGDGRAQGFYVDPLEIVAIVGQRAGKCLAGDTEVFDGEKRCTVESLVGRPPFIVPTKDADAKLRWGKATAFASGHKPCVKLTLVDGSSVTLSTDHQVFTARGWVEAGNLVARDLVATPRAALPTPKQTLQISDSEVTLAAYLLADGGVSQVGTNFTKKTPVIIDEFVAVANELADGNLTRRPHRKVTPELRETIFKLAADGLFQRVIAEKVGLSQTTVNKVLASKEVACLSGVTSKHNITYGVSGLQWFRDKWGINGLSKHKRIPAEFWSLPERQIGLFLNRFWACDGYVEDHALGVTLASEKMIDDLKFLLVRLGIRASKRYKAARCNGKVFDAWRLTVYGHDALTLLKVMGPILSKEQACARLQEELEASSARKDGGAKANHDRVPIGRDEIMAIASEMEEAGLMGRGKRGGRRHEMREFCSAKSGSYVSRGLFEAFCRKFNYSGNYSWLAKSDLRWEFVESVEDRGVLPVFDLSVPDTECFVGNNIVLHNSVTAAICINYLIHRNLMLPVPWKTYGLSPGQIVDFTIVATSVSQVEKTLWSTFKGMLESSAWFTNYQKLCNEEGRKKGLKSTVTLAETYVWFGHKHMLIYFAANNPAGLRGTTRFGAAIDELGWFDSQENSGRIRSNGPETYAALSNACLTLRGAFAHEVERDPATSWPVPLMVSISSPHSMDDPIMSVYRDSATNKRVVRRHWATWEMSPTLPKNLLIETGDLLKRTGPRDYGAQPPIADDPLIQRTDLITEAFKAPLAVDKRYGRIVRPSARGVIHDLEVLGRGRTKQLTAALDTKYEVTIPYQRLRRTKRKYVKALGAYRALFKELLETPATTRNHIMGVDLGASNNALAVVCGFLADDGRKFVTDFALEVKPDAMSINIADVYKNLIVPLIDKLHVCAVFYDRWSCLTGDTLVYTSEGMKKIADMHEDMEGVFPSKALVATKDGVQETSHWGRLPPQDVYDVVLKGGYQLTGTKDHKLWAASADRIGWVPIGSLREGDWVALSSPDLWPADLYRVEYEGRPQQVECAICARKMTNLTRHIIFTHRLDWQEYLDTYRPKWTTANTGKSKSINLPTHVTPELARILGYLVSEGVYGSEFYNTNKQVVDDYCACFEACFGVKPSVVLRKHEPHHVAGNAKISEVKAIYQVLTSCVDIKLYLEHLMGGRDNSHEKRVPPCILQSPKHVAREFLRALYEGDGCCSTKVQRVVYGSASNVLLQQVTSLLANFGIWCFTPACMTGVNAVKFMEEIGFVTKTADLLPKHSRECVPVEAVLRRFVEENRSWLKATDSFTHYLLYRMKDVSKETIEEFKSRYGAAYPEYAKELDDLTRFTWRRVRSITKRPEPEPVYDLTVPGSHSFVANGIVSHNSLHHIQDLSSKFGSLGPLNSTKERRSWLRDLRDNDERPSFIAEQYSLGTGDALSLVSRLEQGDCLFPRMEVGLMELMVNKGLEPKNYPYAHLALQLATVRLRGNRLLKPANRDDDLFRAWANAAVKAFSDELIVDMLLKRSPVSSEAPTVVSAHVSLGMGKKGLRGNVAAGSMTNYGSNAAPVILRKKRG